MLSDVFLKVYANFFNDLCLFKVSHLSSQRFSTFEVLAKHSSLCFFSAVGENAMRFSPLTRAWDVEAWQGDYHFSAPWPRQLTKIINMTFSSSDRLRYRADENPPAFGGSRGGGESDGSGGVVAVAVPSGVWHVHVVSSLREIGAVNSGDMETQLIARARYNPVWEKLPQQHKPEALAITRPWWLTQQVRRSFVKKITSL